MIKAGIIGGTGYTGVELLRILSRHPEVDLAAVTSRTEQGKPVADIFPSLRGVTGLSFSDPETAALENCDLCFFATPSGTAMHQAPGLLEAGVKVIDLSADFRLPRQGRMGALVRPGTRKPGYLGKAVYGLPEVNRAEIREAQLIANPGCIPP